MSVKIHPYKGYLNTKFHIYETKKEQNYNVYKEKATDENLVFSDKVEPNILHEFCLSTSGNYYVKFDSGDVFNIHVEDGYKFGGSKYKNSFIFDDCPWCFIVMNDRTYFYNITTKRSYVEPVSPDKITKISSKYVLLENKDQEEYTVFSLDDEVPILCISNIIAICKNIIVWEGQSDNNKKEFNLVSLQDHHNIICHPCDGYIYDSKEEQILYYLENRTYRISLAKYDEIVSCTSPSLGSIVNIIAPNYVISSRENNTNKDLYIYEIDSGELVKTIKLEGYLAKINGKEIINVKDRQSSLETLDFSTLGVPEAKISAIYHDIAIYPCEWNIFYTISTVKLFKEGCNRITKTEETFLRNFNSDTEVTLKNKNGKFLIYAHAICFFNNSESFTTSQYYGGNGYTDGGNIYIQKNRIYLYKDSCLYTLSRNGYWDNPRKMNLSFKKFSEFGVVEDKDTNTFKTLEGYDLGRCCSISRYGEPFILTKNYYLFTEGRKLERNKISICPNSFSSSLYLGLKINADEIYLYKYVHEKFTQEIIMEDIYDKSHYQDVLLSEDGNYILHRNGKETIVKNIKTNAVQRYDNLSYIKQINGIRPLFSTPSSLQPRIINPITGQFINCDKLSQYKFISPDETLYADTRLNEYIEYYYKDTKRVISQREYNDLQRKYTYPSQEEKDSKGCIEIKEKRKSFLLEHYDYLNEHYTKIFRNDSTGKLWDKFILEIHVDIFLGYLLEKRGIAIIRKIKDDSEYSRIDLGTPLLFINYVAFSHDSKFLGIAGYRNSGGLFLVYDLKSKKTIIHKNTPRAVWSVAFSTKNAIAAYTSTPNSFIATNDEYLYDDIENRLIYGKSFLTFSPDGNYFALSEQSYISKYDKYDNIRENWGHQPSSLVEIRNTSCYKETIFQFSDLGDSGISDSFKRDSVASVSFSNDNSLIMMVGNDGVVIIRKLQLN